MTPQDVFAEFSTRFASRKFSAALLLAFIDMLTELGVPSLSLIDLDDLFRHFPQVTTQANGDPAATLIVRTGQGPSGQPQTLSLRSHYDRAQLLFRETHKRYDFPSSAPYGSGKWREYRPWWDALATFSADDLSGLRRAVVDHVLATLPSQAFDPSSTLREPPLFRMVIESFDLTSRPGEPTGAAYQGLVFGFLRADNPHLQVEIGNVRTGSNRLGRVGDIDGWDGGRPAVSSEVKQFVLAAGDVPLLGDFAHRVGDHGAIGIVTALGFQDGLREQVETLGIRPMDRRDLLSIVDLWDPAKQRIAVASMDYYFRRIERKSALVQRFGRFLADAAATFERHREATDA